LSEAKNSLRASLAYLMKREVQLLLVEAGLKLLSSRGKRTRADGGIGIRDSLRSYWGNPWRFKSSSAHLIINAGVAQLVERNLAKVDVTGSNPASRSIN
jgi:hypothetical protein